MANHLSKLALLRVSTAVAISVSLPACQTAQPLPPPEPIAAAAPAVEPVQPPPPRLYRATGTASWYGTFHHGRKTASGERFDKEAMTAAHRTLPLDTRVVVTNLENGRSVEVTVNDRGPYAKGRLIDLSEAAARRLDFRADGVTRVRVEELPTTGQVAGSSAR